MTEFDPEFDLPRLAVGSHARDTGFACAMNALSWLNGDKVITDRPSSVYPMLARHVIEINDTICTDFTRVGNGLGRVKVLCNACSAKVWQLNARVIGTGSIEPSYELNRDVTFHALDAIVRRIDPDPELQGEITELMDCVKGAFLYPCNNYRIPVDETGWGMVSLFEDAVKFSYSTMEPRTVNALAYAQLCIKKRHKYAHRAHLYLDVFLAQWATPGLFYSSQVNGIPPFFYPNVPTYVPGALEQFNILLDVFERLSGYTSNYAFTKADHLKLIDEAKLVTV